MRTDTELLEWLYRKTQERMVYLEGCGWIQLDRKSISDAMDAEEGK